MHAGQNLTGELARLFGGQLGVFTHNPENRQTRDATLQAEIHHPIGTGQIKIAVVLERRDGNQVDAFGGLVKCVDCHCSDSLSLCQPVEWINQGGYGARYVSTKDAPEMVCARSCTRTQRIYAFARRSSNA